MCGKGSVWHEGVIRMSVWIKRGAWIEGVYEFDVCSERGSVFTEGVVYIHVNRFSEFLDVPYLVL